MRKTWAVLVVMAAVLAPAAATAQLVPGLRVGWSKSAGDIAEGSKLSDALKWQIPIQLDLGYRLLPPLTVGVYGSYGFAKVGDACPDGADCSGSVIDAGVQGTWRFLLAPVSPWAGVGTGYEWARVKVNDSTLRARGWEWVRLMAGVDFPVAGQLAVGPFVQWSIGQYGHLSQGDFSGAPEKKASHQWWTVGLRGTWESLDDGSAARAAEAKQAAEREAAARAAAEKAAAADRAAADKARAEQEAAAAARAAQERAAADQAAAEKAAAEKAAADKAASERAAAEKTENVKLSAGKIEILQSIQFEPGKDVIRPESEPILRDVAKVLSTHPELAKVRIEGYTDSTGAAATNTRLSDLRAKSVKRWLVEKGSIQDGRLQAVGYGPKSPIADNKTAEGRAKNRRVEFKIVE